MIYLSGFRISFARENPRSASTEDKGVTAIVSTKVIIFGNNFFSSLIPVWPICSHNFPNSQHTISYCANTYYFDFMLYVFVLESIFGYKLS